VAVGVEERIRDAAQVKCVETATGDARALKKKARDDVFGGVDEFVWE